jgi:hypothetical protein
MAAGLPMRASAVDMARRSGARAVRDDLAIFGGAHGLDEVVLGDDDAHLAADDAIEA